MENISYQFSYFKQEQLVVNGENVPVICKLKQVLFTF